MKDAKAFDLSDYTDESANALRSEIAKVEALLAGTPTQDEVDAAVTALNDAVDALVEKEVVVPVHTAVLEAALKDAKAIDLKKYTEESAHALLEVIASVEALLEGKPTQEEVNKALADLDVAVESLVIVDTPVDPIDPVDPVDPVDPTDPSETLPGTGISNTTAYLATMMIMGGFLLLAFRRRKSYN